MDLNNPILKDLVYIYGVILLGYFVNPNDKLVETIFSWGWEQDSYMVEPMLSKVLRGTAR
jgi:hypothetical protein